MSEALIISYEKASETLFVEKDGQHPDEYYDVPHSVYLLLGKEGDEDKFIAEHLVGKYKFKAGATQVIITNPVWPERKICFVFSHPTLGDGFFGQMIKDAAMEYFANQADQEGTFTAVNGVRIDVVLTIISDHES
jgi:hypothetical protein